MHLNPALYRLAPEEENVGLLFCLDREEARAPPEGYITVLVEHGTSARERRRAREQKGCEEFKEGELENQLFQCVDVLANKGSWGPCLTRTVMHHISLSLSLSRTPLTSRAMRRGLSC